MKVTGKLLIILTVFLIALVAWSIYDGISGVAFQDLPADEFRAYRLRAWIEPFFTLLPVAVISAIVITFSLAITVYDLGGEGSLVRGTTGALVVVLLLGMLNAFWVFFLDPQLNTSIEAIRYRGRFIRQLEVDIRRDMEIPGRRDLARDRVRVYRALLGEDAEDHEMLRRFEEELGAFALDADNGADTDPDSGAGDDDSILSARERSVLDLIEDAEEALESEDFFSAHYLSTQAIELDGNGDLAQQRARPIQSRAWEAIRSQSREIRQSDERDVFEKKMAAFEALQLGARGAGSPERLIEAYYRFEELRELAPDDPDVERYRAETVAALEQVSFFVEDAAFWATQPAEYDLFFVNRGSHGEEPLEFVWISRTVITPVGIWLYDIEVLRLSIVDGASAGIVHYRSDFGRYLVDPVYDQDGPAPEREDRTGRIVLLGIRRNGPVGTMEQPVDPENVVLPTYYSGGPLTALEETIQLGVPLNDLLRLAGGPERVVRMPLPTLLEARDSFRTIGGNESIIWREIAERILRVFGFFVAAYWAIAFSWKYRSVYLGRAPIPVYLFIPVIPVAVYLILSIGRHVLVGALNGLMLGAGSDVTIVITVIVVSILAVLGAFVVLGRQSAGP